MGKPGYVYVIASAAHQDRCKVGMTLGPPERRLQQLQTGNASKLSLYDFVRVPDPRATEKTLHERLDDFRIRNSEWFATHPSDAARILARLAPAPRRPLLTLASALLNIAVVGGLIYLAILAS